MFAPALLGEVGRTATAWGRPSKGRHDFAPGIPTKLLLDRVTGRAGGRVLCCSREVAARPPRENGRSFLRIIGRKTAWITPEDTAGLPGAAPSRTLANVGMLVPLAGIEPALLAELDFESSASTNSATGASAAGPREAGAL